MAGLGERNKTNARPKNKKRKQIDWWDMHKLVRQYNTVNISNILSVLFVQRIKLINLVVVFFYVKEISQIQHI